MNGDAWIAVIGSVLVGVVVRLSNVVVEALSRVLGVKPPEPVPVPEEAITAPRPAQSHTPANPETP